MILEQYFEAEIDGLDRLEYSVCVAVAYGKEGPRGPMKVRLDGAFDELKRYYSVTCIIQVALYIQLLIQALLSSSTVKQSQ